MLIEMCAWSLVTDALGGVPRGLLDQICLSTIGDVHGDSTDRLGWDRHRQTHHWICAVDADGGALVGEGGQHRGRPRDRLGDGVQPTAGTFTFTVRVTDYLDVFSEKELSITIT